MIYTGISQEMRTLHKEANGLFYISLAVTISVIIMGFISGALDPGVDAFPDVLSYTFSIHTLRHMVVMLAASLSAFLTVRLRMHAKGLYAKAVANRLMEQECHT